MSFKVVDWVQKAKPFKISDLLPFKLNAKEHPEEQIRGIVESIKKFGIYAPVVIDREMVIIAGHGRIEAAKRLGIDEFPCIQRDDLTDDEVSALRLIDNRIAETGWDASNLKTVLDKLDFDFEPFAVNFDEIVQKLGADDELNDAEPQIDRAAELNEKWQVKSGDLWLIGEHRLLCGDSTKADQVERLMAGHKVTCVFTDPPYGVSIGKKNVMLNTFQPSGRCLANLEMDDMKPDELKEMLLAVFSTWKPFFADDCSVFVCSPQGGGLGMMMMMMMQESGLEVRHILNWIKNCPTFSMGRLDYDYQHEPILFTWMKTHKRKKSGQFQTSLWSVDKPMANKEHPTMKPIELPANAILNHTDDGDIVADMFLGSGSTMVAAQNHNRRCFGMEISPNYCAVILERMSNSFPEIEIKRGE